MVDSRRIRCAGVVLIACMAVVMATANGRGDDPAEIDPTGGLRSRGGSAPSPSPSNGISREELIRQWDLDADGTIDASEAAVARARMRRSRLGMEMRAGIDPLTGKPRAAVEGTTEEPADEEPPRLDDDLPSEPRARAATTNAPPGTRVPEVKSVVGGTVGSHVPRITGSGTGAGAGAKPGVPRPSPASSRPGALTGGVRAGSPAARSGYGSLAPKPDLNAGLPRSFGRPIPPGTGPQTSRGGFLPTTRSPAVPRPLAPSPAPPTPSRVTADEIGGF